MKLSLYQIDAFTEKLFGGNPAAVIPLSEWLTDAEMQNIAAENNLSETAFYVPNGDFYELRWFSPTTEVDLCGHATLAAAHVLFGEMKVNQNEIPFQTKSGLLKVRNEYGLLVMDFPAAKLDKMEATHQLTDALKLNSVKEVYKSDDLLVVLDNENEVRKLAPDIRLISEIETRGIIVTAISNDEQTDFVSRFFAPRVGVDEDPVTGSAHTKLIPYWSRILRKNELKARQLSKRGGRLNCKMNNNRVEIAGNAVTYLKGEIYIA